MKKKTKKTKKITENNEKHYKILEENNYLFFCIFQKSKNEHLQTPKQATQMPNDRPAQK